MSETLPAALAVAGGIVAPGWVVVRGLGLAESALARLVVAAAVGRVLFAAVSLVAVHAGGGALLLAFAGASSLAAFAVELRARRGAPASSGVGREGGALARFGPPLAAVAAAALLVHAVVARSGLPDADGALVFFGRDATNDPLVYGAVSWRLAQTGLPLALPFAGGWPAPGSYGHYAVEAGLHLLSGASTLALSFRVIPYLDAGLLTLSGVALVRALGGGAAAATAAGVLLALGAEASFLVAPLAALIGVAPQPLDSWAIFGPYLAAFNPGTAALHAWLAAALLLAAGGAATASAVVAGLLVASLFEWKVFLWAPVLVALLAVAFVLPPPSARRRLRLAGLAALLGSLPSVLDRVVGSQAGAGADETGLDACIGCLPRYLADAAWGSRDLSFALFRQFEPVQLARPEVWLATLAASVIVGLVVLGARLVAVPALWRGALAAGDTAAVHRWIALSALAGLAGAAVLVAAPHYLNGAQLAWAASFGLWVPAALQLERWLRARRFVAVAVALGLALPGSAVLAGRLGYAAPVSLRVSAEEQALLEELARHTGPDDVVLEPSMLVDTDRPSPLPWLVGRPVRLSLLSAVQSLPEEERNRRFDELVTLFAGDDAGAAGIALARSGARFVYVPADWPLRYDPGAFLEPVVRSPAGVLYRVRGAGAAS